jgi:DNA-binding NarL/FixJ family response regulator
LVADDTEDDRFFLRRLLDRFPQFSIIAEVCDGEEAIGYLADATSALMPDLLFLDLKMPHRTGFEVLEWLQTHVHSFLTVAVLSSSGLIEDQHKSLELGASGFWMKTSDLADQEKMMASIEAVLDLNGKEKRPPRPLSAKSCIVSEGCAVQQ